MIVKYIMNIDISKLECYVIISGVNMVKIMTGDV